MSWFRRWFDRRAPSQTPSPAGLSPHWQKTLARTMPYYHVLSPDERMRLGNLIEQFVREKEFWGNRDLIVTEEMKRIVAAQACLLILNLPRLGLYPETREIILYPDDFGEVLEAIGPSGRSYTIDLSRIGEASRRGPILLAWDHVKQSAGDRFNGRNVVFHEFAHALDYLNGSADGAPPLERPEDVAVWARVMKAEYDALRFTASMGRRSLLDPYGAENPAEFFAVATEHFFDQGHRLKRNHPALYAQLKKFYQQDPANWSTG